MPKKPPLTIESLPLRRVQSELGSLLERVCHRAFSLGPFDGQDWAPAVELCEEPERYVVVVELPGVEASVIDVTAGPGHLEVAGERARPEPLPTPDGKGAQVIQTERRYGTFKRRIELPGPIDVSDVAVAFESGLLTVTLPRASGPAATAVHVPVRAPE